MKMPVSLFRSVALLVLASVSGHAAAQEIRVAVASNFADAATEISRQFEIQTGHKVTMSFGSTGKHYSQIKNGAPFDVFLAADIKRPQLLEQDKMAVYGSRFTYAVGRIVLWSPMAGQVDREGRVLSDGDFRHLAIANPELAPYGRAAREVLQGLGLWDRLKVRLVRGENIAQAFQFVRTGNAELGFVALSQIQHAGRITEGSFWLAPQKLYTPVRQQAVLLRDDDASRAFLLFLRGDRALKIIRDYGYDTP